MGGTAIHIAYELPRFSEDLDFDNIGLNKKGFSLLSEIIGDKLKLQGYNIELKTSFKGAYRTYIRISGLLFEFKLSPYQEEKMLIQLDTEPQKFSYKPDKVILNKFDVFTQINVVPLDILLSQKLYAIFMRRRPMGRDFFDAIFLFGKIKPNYDYLKTKIKIDNLADMKKALIKHCNVLDFKLLAKDTCQFLFDSQEAKKIELFCEYIKSLK